MYRIFIVDDDIELCKVIKLRLQKENYYVDVCNDGEEAIKTILQNGDYDLVVLDIMLPKKDGFEVLMEVRKNFFAPILILTAKDSENDKISGLRMGADDYLTKPYLLNEFVERINSLIRRYKRFNNKTPVNDIMLSFQGITINYSKREVYINNHLVQLTPKEFEILYFLARNNEQVFTKKQIHHNLWEDEYSFDDNNIMVHIQRLRKKIDNHSLQYEFIQTIWGIGYKFVGKERG